MTQVGFFKSCKFCNKEQTHNTKQTSIIHPLINYKKSHKFLVSQKLCRDGMLFFDSSLAWELAMHSKLRGSTMRHHPTHFQLHHRQTSSDPPQSNQNRNKQVQGLCKWAIWAVWYRRPSGNPLILRFSSNHSAAIFMQEFKTMPSAPSGFSYFYVPIPSHHSGVQVPLHLFVFVLFLRFLVTLFLLFFLRNLKKFSSFHSLRSLLAATHEQGLVQSFISYIYLSLSRIYLFTWLGF